MNFYYYFKKFENWLMYSSKNPEQISLTIRSFFYLVTSLGIYHNIDINQIVDLVIQFITLLTSVISGIATAYGIGRKIINSLIN